MIDNIHGELEYNSAAHDASRLHNRASASQWPTKKSNQIKFINIQQQILKSTQAKRNTVNNVRLLNGEAGHKWL